MDRMGSPFIPSVLFAVLFLPLLASQSLAVDLIPKKGGIDLCNQERPRNDPELARRLGCSYAKPVTGRAAVGGAANQTAGGAISGSSEHSSIRGTINGGGDFIAPKLQEKAPPQPRGVAPRPKQ